MLMQDLKKLNPEPLPQWFDIMKAKGMFDRLMPMQVKGFGPKKEIEIDTEAYAALARNKYPQANKDVEPACYLGIDQQVGFCFKGGDTAQGGDYPGSLYVPGSENDCRRAMEMILRWPTAFAYMAVSLDTHFKDQIFHREFWINASGQHPEPGTKISFDDLKKGNWRAFDGRFTHKVMAYIEELEKMGLFQLIIWPFHTMLAFEDHALMPVVSRTMFYHSIIRHYAPHLEVKGNHALTEHYSIMGPEVRSILGEPTVDFNTNFFNLLLRYNRIVVAGEAKDFCVLRTLQDLLQEIFKKDPTLTQKVIVLEDCISPVYPSGGEQQIKDLVAKYDIKLRNSTAHISEILA